jgi:type IV secretory pathway VirB2 component (pilin)
MYKNSYLYNSIMLLISFFCIMFFTESSLASNSSAAAGGGLGDAMCNVVNMLTGKVGKAIATIALIFLAFGLFVGKVTWGLAVSLGIAIATIFGADQLINIITGDAATTDCGTTS